MEKADYFKVYGYLLTLRDIFEQKARDAARRGVQRYYTSSASRFQEGANSK